MWTELLLTNVIKCLVITQHECSKTFKSNTITVRFQPHHNKHVDHPGEEGKAMAWDGSGHQLLHSYNAY